MSLNVITPVDRAAYSALKIGGSSGSLLECRYIVKCYYTHRWRRLFSNQSKRDRNGRRRNSCSLNALDAASECVLLLPGKTTIYVDTRDNRMQSCFPVCWNVLRRWQPSLPASRASPCVICIPRLPFRHACQNKLIPGRSRAFILIRSPVRLKGVRMRRRAGGTGCGCLRARPRKLAPRRRRKTEPGRTTAATFAGAEKCRK